MAIYERDDDRRMVNRGGRTGFRVDAEQGPELLDLEETVPAGVGPARKGEV